MNKKTKSDKPVTTALLLAAGTGSRLYPLTKNEPKCMTSVNGETILERMISNLIKKGITRLVIVTGHLEHCIREYLGDQVGQMKIEYLFSPLYKSTNNIYSLWMARKIINEPFLLLESDLVFDNSLLDEMIYPDRIALAKMQSWMNGTCVTVNQSQIVDEFLDADIDTSEKLKYKTVNIYCLSLASWRETIKRLDKQISEGNVNSYYETVFANMISENCLDLKSVFFDAKPWYEIDTLGDLAEAEKIFPSERRSIKVAHNIEVKELHRELLTGTLSTPKSAGVLHAVR